MRQGQSVDIAKMGLRQKQNGKNYCSSGTHRYEPFFDIISLQGDKIPILCFSEQYKQLQAEPKVRYHSAEISRSK